MKILAKALREDTEFSLGLTLIAGSSGLHREIDHPRVQKPGLALAGFVETIRGNRLQVLGKTEIEYLSSLDDAAQLRSIRLLYDAGIACAVITTTSPAPKRLLEEAERYGIPLFVSDLSSGTFIGRVHEFLEESLSPEVMLHGVLVDVFGVGVVLTGPSGIGKSECALDLILRSHRLIADDVVLIRLRKGQLFGTGSPVTRHHMEVRGLGIINVLDLFGAASVRDKKRVELIVDMFEWHGRTSEPSADSKSEPDRTGLDEHTERILDVDVAKVRLPIRPGRNVASIVEVAARNHLLKLQGHNAAQKFKESLEARLARPQREERD